jgi:hypothetical protein
MDFSIRQDVISAFSAKVRGDLLYACIRLKDLKLKEKEKQGEIYA